MKRYINYIVNLIVLLFFGLYWNYGTPLLFYCGAAIMIISFMLFSTMLSYSSYAFLLPAISSLKQSNDSFALFFVLTMILLIKLVFTHKTRINVISVVIVALSLMCSSITYLLNGAGFTYLLADIRVAITLLLLFNIGTLFIKHSDDSGKIILQSFIYGTLCEIVISTIFNIQPLMQGTFRLKFINSDPNYTGLCLALASAIQLLFIKRGKSKNIFLFLIFLIFGLCTQSRGFLVAESIVVISFFGMLISKKQISSMKKILTLIVIIIAAIVIIRSPILDGFKARFTDESTMDGGSGRISIWKEYFRLWMTDVSTLFFGIGYTNTVLGQGLVQHNLYIEVLTSKGIVGLLIWIISNMIILKSLKTSFRIKHISYSGVLALFTVAISYFFLNAATSDFGWMTIYMGMLSLCWYDCAKKDDVSININFDGCYKNKKRYFII